MANKYTGTKTEKNLQEAFSGESQARNKYTYFASVAKKEGETLLAPVRAFIDREQYAMNSAKKTKVCKAQLGNDAGIIGAALLGKQED